ncbi:Adenosine monophosphate-protein transferase FICD [Echinococcus granulosus]|uniref:protein adenylyltransferase n=2 Tax=Echinococcus granulosus TaxID=6210 RepID=W6VA60_ECHGR|nr:Adenosine monophosphate-protein transferase FICD [Echinococcus granulosus]EUB63644.1 Adenosine monophosphate-protein transferase FICD [Echinococcus granulosus]
MPACGRFLLLYVFLVIFCLALCPYSLWVKLTSGFHNCLKLANLEVFLKSSTLYVITRKYFLRNTNFDNSTSQHCVSIGSDVNLHDYEPMRSLIHSTQSRVNDYVKFANAGSVECASLCKEAKMSMILAVKHQAAGHSEMALKLLKHAAELDPKNSDILNLLGEAFEKLWITSKGNKINSAVLSYDELITSMSPDQVESIVTADSLYTKALISDPANTRASNNRRRTLPIVEKIDRQRFQKIDLKVVRFYLVPESDPGLKKAKIEHYFQHIYHSNAIEGNTLSLAQTRAVLETRLAIGGKSLQEQNEILGLDAAFKYLNTTLLSGSASPISLSDILELHRRVLSFINLAEAGHLRQTQVFVGDHIPPPANMLPDLMQELVDWINSDEAAAMHPIELAALAHWKLVYIHPFYDGNGRTSRLVMNLLLMRAGFPPAIVRKDDRHIYYETLKAANSGDVRPFIRFIAECAERAVDDYLKAAFGTATSEIEKKIVISSNRPSLYQLGPLAQCIPALHFPWMPHERTVGQPNIIYSTMILGLSPPFIKLYRHLLCEYDSRVSLFLSSNNFLLHETEDHRFIELLYRICRDIFTMKPPLSLTQFLTNSFAGQKLKMATEIVKAVGELQKDLRRKAPKNRDVLSLICSPSAGPGGIRQRASQGACGDGAGGAVRGVGTTFPRSSQQNQLSSTQQTRLLIPPQQADAISSPTTDAESLCADDRLSPDHLHRGTLLAFPLQSKPKPGSSPSIVKDSLGCAKNEYLPGLLTTLNTLSNQLSQIVDRVAGIELRVCAIEKPIREAATNQAGPLVDKEKLKSKEKLTPHDSRRTDPHDITGLSPDSADRSDRVHSDEATPRPHLNILYPPIEEQLVYWRSRHPQDQLSVAALISCFLQSLSETSASVEINDPLLSSINTSAAFSGRCQLQDVPDASISGRYSPRVSIHKEDCNAGSTNPITEAQAVLTVVNNPVFRQTFEQGAPIHQRGGPNSPLQPFTEPLHGKALPQSLATAAFHELSLFISIPIRQKYYSNVMLAVQLSNCA